MESLEAWLALISVNYHRNMLVLIFHNRWLALLEPCFERPVTGVLWLSRSSSMRRPEFDSLLPTVTKKSRKHGDWKLPVPVIIGDLGRVKKGTENYIGKISGNIRITELQKIVLLETAHILKRTLSTK